jgi:hypothetical protein
MLFGKGDPCHLAFAYLRELDFSDAEEDASDDPAHFLHEAPLLLACQGSGGEPMHVLVVEPLCMPTSHP